MKDYIVTYKGLEIAFTNGTLTFRCCKIYLGRNDRCETIPFKYSTQYSKIKNKQSKNKHWVSRTASSMINDEISHQAIKQAANHKKHVQKQIHTIM